MIQLRTASATGVFFIAQFPCVVNEFAYVWEGVSTGTINLEKLTGTTVPGSGINILSAAIDVSTTANMVGQGTFVIGSARELARGDRLGLKAASGAPSPAGFNGLALIAPLGKGHYQSNAKSLI